MGGHEVHNTNPTHLRSHKVVEVINIGNQTQTNKPQGKSYKRVQQQLSSVFSSGWDPEMSGVVSLEGGCPFDLVF